MPRATHLQANVADVSLRKRAPGGPLSLYLFVSLSLSLTHNLTCNTPAGSCRQCIFYKEGTGNLSALALADTSHESRVLQGGVVG